MKSQLLLRDQRLTSGLPRFMFWLLPCCEGCPRLRLRFRFLLVTACIVAAQIMGLEYYACAQTTARVGVCQPAAGFARRGGTSAVIGLPAPFRAIQLPNRSSSTLVSPGSIDVPLEFGSRVTWKVYDMGGREVQAGTSNIPETGSRSIDVGSTQGLCLLVLTSADGLIILRKAVFFGR